MRPRPSHAKPHRAENARRSADRSEPRPHGPRRSPAAKSVSRGSVPADLTDAARGVRLQKALAEAGVASRREAESLVAEGRVTVNGDFVTALPAWVDPARDRIEVDGRPIRRTHGREARGPGARDAPGGAPASHALTERKVVVALHKPRRVISTARDPEGRASVVDLVDLGPGLPQRLFPVGRLDAESTGLILLTNDGELANRLTHPRYGVAKEYVVSIRGHLGPEDVARLEHGLFLAHPRATRANRAAGPPSPRGGTPQPAAVRVKRAAMERVRLLGHERDETRGDRTKVHVTLREGQNREIRRLMARLGFNVRRLQRVAIGPVTLKGLASGQWRLLTPGEVRALHKAGDAAPVQSADRRPKPPA